jgi:ribosomal protein S18 acetylase RimI-like enzyme
VNPYRIEAELAVAADIEAAFEWYQREQPDLGFEFLEELRATYQRILEGPLKYSVLRSGIRRALSRRFPYAIYFSSGLSGTQRKVYAYTHPLYPDSQRAAG